MEVRGGIAVEIDRADLDLIDGHAHLAADDQHLHLEIVTARAKPEQALRQVARDAAQPRLGIGQRHAQKQAEQPAGKGVADAASQGHGSKEPPHAEDQRAGLLFEPIADPAGVLGVVLTVGVERDDPRGVTEAGEADVHGGA